MNWISGQTCRQDSRQPRSGYVPSDQEFCCQEESLEWEDDVDVKHHWRHPETVHPVEDGGYQLLVNIEPPCETQPEFKCVSNLQKSGLW